MTVSADSRRRPIVVRWLWDDCHLNEGQRAFIVEIPAERMPATGGVSTPGPDLDTYLEVVARQAHQWPGTVLPGHVSCIVTPRGQLLRVFQSPVFAYSGLWNGYCPLVRLGVLVTDLAAIGSISDELIDEAVTLDLRSTWCMSQEDWDGTELGASGLLDT